MFEPVAFIPAKCQTSSMVASTTSAMSPSITGSSLSPASVVISRTWSAFMIPLANGQRPVTRHPPSTGTAVPDALAWKPAERAAGANGRPFRSWRTSWVMATLCTTRNEYTHAVDAQPWARMRVIVPNSRMP